MKTSWKPRVAGILCLVSVFFPWLLALIARTMSGNISQTSNIFLWIFIPIIPVIGHTVPFSVFGNAPPIPLIGIISILAFIVSLPLAIIGGIMAIRRKLWGLALAGSIGAFICSPLLGIAAIILVAQSRRGFK